jgi:hypothetical protein
MDSAGALSCPAFELPVLLCGRCSTVMNLALSWHFLASSFDGGSACHTADTNTGINANIHTSSVLELATAMFERVETVHALDGVASWKGYGCI